MALSELHSDFLVFNSSLSPLRILCAHTRVGLPLALIPLTLDCFLVLFRRESRIRRGAEKLEKAKSVRPCVCVLSLPSISLFHAFLPVLPMIILILFPFW